MLIAHQTLASLRACCTRMQNMASAAAMPARHGTPRPRLMDCTMGSLNKTPLPFRDRTQL